MSRSDWNILKILKILKILPTWWTLEWILAETQKRDVGKWKYTPAQCKLNKENFIKAKEMYAQIQRKHLHGVRGQHP